MIIFSLIRKGFTEFLTHLPYFIAWWTTWQLMDLAWEMLKVGIARAGN